MGLGERCAIAVMAKAPRAGFVKTRLCPPLDPEEARALSAAFLRDTTGNIEAVGRDAPVDGFVAFAPAGMEHLFEGMVAPSTRFVLADGTQGDAAGVDGFGRSLLHAMRALFALGYGAACVLNADGPTLPAAYLAEAAQRLLAGERAVIGPAEDGGYYLLGLREADPKWFAGVVWSTDAVFAQTRAAAGETPLHVLPPWYDVDDAGALRRLLGETGGYAAPATRAALERLDIARKLA